MVVYLRGCQVFNPKLVENDETFDSTTIPKSRDVQGFFRIFWGPSVNHGNLKGPSPMPRLPKKYGANKALLGPYSLGGSP